MQRTLGPARLAVLAAAFAALFALAPGAALANHVQCGDAITQDTKLDSDVICTGTEFDPLTGLVIGANGVTLDLNGFSILGPNRGEQVEDQVGIMTSGAIRSVTIRNGEIRGFSEGLALEVSGSTIRDLTSSGRLRLRGDGNVVRDCFFSDGDTGVAVSGDDNRILRSYAFGYDGEGISATGARNQLIGNTAESFVGVAIRVEQFSDVVLRKNLAPGNGIYVQVGSGGVVERNVADGNSSGYGISIGADDLLIRKNHASRNYDGGIYVYGVGNTITQNVANFNGEHLDDYGIYVVPGNVDGGGNRASGNGAPQQCLGVRCK
jgi:parallel beta-helix repeat protein